MTDRHPPVPNGPVDDDDAALPSVFDSLVGIDIVDGELVPRVAKPPRS